MTGKKKKIQYDDQQANKRQKQNTHRKSCSTLTREKKKFILATYKQTNDPKKKILTPNSFSTLIFNIHSYKDHHPTLLISIVPTICPEVVV